MFNVFVNPNGTGEFTREIVIFQWKKLQIIIRNKTL